MLNAHKRSCGRESAYRDHPFEGQTINNALHRRMWGLSGRLIDPQRSKKKKGNYSIQVWPST